MDAVITERAGLKGEVDIGIKHSTCGPPVKPDTVISVCVEHITHSFMEVTILHLKRAKSTWDSSAVEVKYGFVLHFS